MEEIVMGGKIWSTSRQGDPQARRPKGAVKILEDRPLPVVTSNILVPGGLAEIVEQAVRKQLGELLPIMMRELRDSLLPPSLPNPPTSGSPGDGGPPSVKRVAPLIGDSGRGSGKKGKEKVPMQSVAVRQPTAGPSLPPKGEKKVLADKPRQSIPHGGKIAADTTATVQQQQQKQQQDTPLLFTEVVKRRSMKKKVTPPPSSAGVKSAQGTTKVVPKAAPKSPPSPPKQGTGEEKGRREKKKRKVPNTAAVSLICPVGEYAAVMKRVTGEISLKEMGIPPTTPKAGQTGALIIQIPGPEGQKRADMLAQKMRNMFADRPEIRINRPQKMGEIRIRDLAPSTTAESVARAVAERGECSPTEVKVGDIKSSPIPRGLYTAWAKCPLRTANKVAQEGHIIIDGFFRARANLNHARRAQDLFMEDLCESDAGLGVVAEPYRVPESDPNWVSASSGSVAIVRKHSPRSPRLTLVERGEGFVIARWGALYVVGVYAPPKRPHPEFREHLQAIGAGIRRCLPHPVLVAGDFNAWAQEWDSRFTNIRGEAVLTWAAGLGLLLQNRGSNSTCIRPRGESIVDLTWASLRAADLVRTWEVANRESLSDYLYIEMVLNATPQEVLTRRHRLRGEKPPRRWALAQINQDRLVAAALVEAWSDPPDLVDTGAEVEEIGDMCACGEDKSTAKVREKYLAARCSLRTAIGRAKAKVWEELLAELDRDPWGRPYRLVLNRLRPATLPISETLDPGFLDQVVGSLFPVKDTHIPPKGDPTDWTEDLGISERELSEAAKRLGAAGKAPGPDGVPGRVWTLAFGVVGARLRRLYNACLRTGTFPSLWKKANLVLLRKEGKPAEQPSAYRPICLLDKVGKLFERPCSKESLPAESSSTCRGMVPIYRRINLGSERPDPQQMRLCICGPSRTRL
ncbi:uncharacterized protein [Linepithema humile]|uniref:uncharacterized protein n=1 Tax=Linepithema humile TaxID=83485 RepID=UPI00351E4D58